VAKVIFAGAGTAGHIEPALAVAREVKATTSDVTALFLGTATGLENTLVPAAGFELALIEKAPFPRRLNAAAFKWPFRFIKTLSQTRSILRGADVVVGFGGYVAAPAYICAWSMRIPVIAHEANAKIGLANRLASKFGARLLTAFPVPGARLVGIPLRKEITALALQDRDSRLILKKSARERIGISSDAKVLLIFGGSLGAQRFNEVIAGNLDFILGSGITVVHAVGSSNELPSARPGYIPMPYISDMASAYSAADLVISRSGAVTVVETGSLGLYSLYVPLAIGNGEQAANAQYVVDRGGGELLANSQFNAAWLQANISRLMDRALNWSIHGTRVDFPLDAAEVIAHELLVSVNNG